MEIELDESLVAKHLFCILKKKISKRSSQRIFVVDLSTIKNIEKLQAIMEVLRSRSYITYRVNFNILIINATEKCILRIVNYDNW